MTGLLTPLHKYTARPDAPMAPVDPSLVIPDWPGHRPSISEDTRWRIVAYAMARAEKMGAMS